MLVELRLENYAVIDNVVVEFASGLNLLTGETGAGKSILMTRSACFSEKRRRPTSSALAPSERWCRPYSRPKATRKKPSPVYSRANGLDADNDSLILRREIAAAGQGPVFVNNQPATVAVLRQLGRISPRSMRKTYR